MTHVSTLAQNLLVTSFALNTQTRLGDLQVQIASGEKSQRYSGIAPDASRLLNLETQNQTATAYNQSIDIVQTRIKLMSTGLQSLDDAAENFGGTLALQSSGQGAVDTRVWSQADDLMKQVQDILNLKDDSGYLFAGERRDNAPADLTYATINGAAPFPAAPAGGPPPLTPAPPLTTAQIDQIAAAYYSGSTGSSNLSVRVDDGTPPVSYGVKANEDAFKYLVAGLQMVRQANTKFPADPTSAADIDTAYLQNGMELINKAINGDPTPNYPGQIEGLRGVISRVAQTSATLSTIEDRHTSFINYAQTAIGDINQVNTADAVTKLNSDQVALQAAFSTLARLQQATLLNYLT